MRLFKTKFMKEIGKLFVEEVNGKCLFTFGTEAYRGIMYQTLREDKGKFVAAVNPEQPQNFIIGKLQSVEKKVCFIPIGLELDKFKRYLYTNNSNQITLFDSIKYLEKENKQYTVYRLTTVDIEYLIKNFK